MGYGIVGILILVLDIIAILNILQSGLSTVMKLVWILIVLVLPIIGMILWFLIGAKRVAI